MDRQYGQIIVDRIRTLCKTRGISITKLAEMSDVKHSTLDNIMQGNSLNPGIGTIHKVALAFNMTLSEFTDYPAMNDYSFEKDEDEED